MNTQPSIVMQAFARMKSLFVLLRGVQNSALMIAHSRVHKKASMLFTQCYFYFMMGRPQMAELCFVKIELLVYKTITMLRQDHAALDQMFNQLVLDARRYHRRSYQYLVLLGQIRNIREFINIVGPGDALAIDCAFLVCDMFNHLEVERGFAPYSNIIVNPTFTIDNDRLTFRQAFNLVFGHQIATEIFDLNVVSEHLPLNTPLLPQFRSWMDTHFYLVSNYLRTSMQGTEPLYENIQYRLSLNFIELSQFDDSIILTELGDETDHANSFEHDISAFDRIVRSSLPPMVLYGDDMITTNTQTEMSQDQAAAAVGATIEFGGIPPQVIQQSTQEQILEPDIVEDELLFGFVSDDTQKIYNDKFWSDLLRDAQYSEPELFADYTSFDGPLPTIKEETDEEVKEPDVPKLYVAQPFLAPLFVVFCAATILLVLAYAFSVYAIDYLTYKFGGSTSAQLTVYTLLMPFVTKVMADSFAPSAFGIIAYYFNIGLYRIGSNKFTELYCKTTPETDFNAIEQSYFRFDVILQVLAMNLYKVLPITGMVPYWEEVAKEIFIQWIPHFNVCVCVLELTERVYMVRWVPKGYEKEFLLKSLLIGVFVHIVIFPLPIWLRILIHLIVNCFGAYFAKVELTGIALQVFFTSILQQYTPKTILNIPDESKKSQLEGTDGMNFPKIFMQMYDRTVRGITKQGTNFSDLVQDLLLNMYLWIWRDHTSHYPSLAIAHEAKDTVTNLHKYWEILIAAEGPKLARWFFSTAANHITFGYFSNLKKEKRELRISRKINRGEFRSIAIKKFGWSPAKIPKSSWMSLMIEDYFREPFDVEAAVLKHFKGDIGLMLSHCRDMRPELKPKKPQVTQSKRSLRKQKKLAKSEAKSLALQQTGWDAEYTCAYCEKNIETENSMTSKLELFANGTLEVKDSISLVTYVFLECDTVLNALKMEKFSPLAMIKQLIRIHLTHNIFPQDYLSQFKDSALNIVHQLMAYFEKVFENRFISGLTEGEAAYTAPFDFIYALGKSELMGVIQALSYSSIVLIGIAGIRGFENAHVNNILNAIGGVFTGIKEFPTFAKFVEIIHEQLIPAIINGDISYLKQDIDVKKRMAVVALMSAITVSDYEQMRVHIREYEDKEKTMVAIGTPENLQLIYSNYGPYDLFNHSYRLLLQYQALAITKDKQTIGFLDGLQSAICLCRAKSANMRRRQPMTIGLKGPAGTGKSSEYTELAIAATSKALQLEIEQARNDDGSTQWVPISAETYPIGNKFADNISTTTQVIKFDDLGIVNPDMTSPEMTLQQMFMNVTGADWSVIPRSGLEAKQGQFFNNRLTILTSNEPDYLFPVYIRTKEAWQRRITLDIIVTRMPDGQYDHLDGEFFQRCGITPPDPPVKFIVSEHIQNSTTRVIHKIENEIALAKLISKTADTFVTGQAAHAQRVREAASICTKCKNVLITHQIVNGLHVCPPPAALLVKPDNLFDMFTFTMVEEIVFIAIQWLLLILVVHYGNVSPVAHSILGVLLACLRLILEEGISFEPVVVIKGLFFIVLHCNPDIIRFLLHLLYNTFVYRALVVEMYNDGVASVWNRTNSIIGGERANHIINQAVAGAKQVQEAQKLGVLIGKIVVFGLSLNLLYKGVKFLLSMRDMYATYTHVDATEKEVQLNSDLSKMYDHKPFEGPTTGRTSSWAQFKHQSQSIIYSNGTVANSAILNTVLVTVKIVDSSDLAYHEFNIMGYIHRGIVYTVSHGFEQWAADLRCASFNVIINYFKRKTSGSGEPVTMSRIIPKDEIKRVVDRDMVLISFNSTFTNNTPIVQELLFQEGDEFISYTREGEQQKYVLASLSEMEITCRRETPNGIFTKKERVHATLRGDKSTLGDSGRPIFLVKRAGRPTVATFIGIQTAKTHIDDICIVRAPSTALYTSQNVFSTLEKPSDDLLLKTVFEHEGRKVKYEHSTKDEISHFSSISNVGRYYGILESQPINNMKTSYRKTEFYPQAVLFCPDVEKLGPPVKTRGMDGDHFFSAILGWLARSQRAVTIVDQSNMIECAKQVFHDLHSKMDLSFNTPLSNEQVIAGAFNVNPMDGDKSAGFFFPGRKKRDLLCEHLGKPMLKAELLEKIQETYRMMEEHAQILNVCVAAEKDELKDKKKFVEGLTRLFFAGDIVFMWFCKKYLGPFFALLMAIRDNISCQVGINAIGPEFHEMLHKMCDGDFKDPGATDGDWSGWDTSVLGMLYALTVIYWMFEESPYYRKNPKELFYVKCILEAMGYWVAILNKQIIIKEGQMPSGEYGTSQINSLGNEILAVYRFYYCYARHKGYNINGLLVKRCSREILYHEQVKPKTFGDDIMEFFAKDARFFMNTQYVVEFAKLIGMDWTPARKEEVGFSFKPITEIMFLKRTPRFEPILNRYVGCLEMKSVAKMLGYRDSDDPKWSEAVIYTAIREMAFHGEERYQMFGNCFSLSLPPREEILLEIEKHGGFFYNPQKPVTVAQAEFEVDLSMSD